MYACLLDLALHAAAAAASDHYHAVSGCYLTAHVVVFNYFIIKSEKEAKMRLLTLIFLPILLITTIEGARILAVFPVPNSHFRFCRKVLAVLAESGHEIVALVPMMDGKIHANVKEIPLGIKDIQDTIPQGASSLIRDISFFESQKYLWSIANTFVDYTTHNLTTIKDFIKTDKSHFDLVIVEEFFIQAYYGFAHKYKAPLMLVSVFGSAHFINEYTGNSVESSYVTHEFADMFKMSSLYERAKNLVYVTYDLIGRKLYNLEHQNRMAKELFADPSMPHVAELERDAAVVFLNMHFSMGVNQPFLTNMVQIGGLHIEEAKPLEPNFKQILDNAHDGAIIFSLGSVMDLSYQPEDKLIQILKALGRFKQAVFIKYDSDKPLPAKFNNIHHFKWLPQNDILAHPNTIAFVTHGGLSSAQEAIHHGVPVVCVPFFGDQPVNCLKSQVLGYGLTLKNNELNEESLYTMLNKIVTDTSYKKAAKELSKRFRDRPMSPRDQVVYWTEYALRHKGADFMKGPKRNMYWYQILYFDLLAVVLLVCWLIKKIVSKILCAIFSSKITDVRKKIKIN